MFAHLGTFTIEADVRHCLDLAAAALRRYGLDAWFPPDDGEFVIVGGDDRVAVQVSCAPVQDATWVAVVGYSTDAAVAEYGRNAIRAHMTNPASPPLPPP
ncbi:hypothetical protein [Saccharothrix luteola]|uniref:hypothetical protein n=1 Tax=Saccharothrix luteola TaxID=2893018 RepID=UPI001E29B31B|nr:hypothetical protein [Saccharothrix luteola]MCC8250584.1 hypothetical protein [Saccharothrix luteola]